MFRSNKLKQIVLSHFMILTSERDTVLVRSSNKVRVSNISNFNVVSEVKGSQHVIYGTVKLDQA